MSGKKGKRELGLTDSGELIMGKLKVNPAILGIGGTNRILG